ncbi:PAS domain-containing sensor histidine kinase [Massilia sp. S19_KUP03_FR1]|uniref:PAS domain-containing sensor histidine kinase n=1 Tax=Massilia sp. S19_KUP03_FR1 TaxID=3025503 RepID=UPI002FCD8487
MQPISTRIRSLIPTNCGIRAKRRQAATPRRANLAVVSTFARKLKRSQLDNIVMSAMDAIVTIDEQHGIILFNTAAERMFGYAATEVLGSPLSKLLPQRFHAAHGQQIADFSDSGSVARRMGNLGAVPACRADGTEFSVEVAISHYSDGARVHYTAIIRDVTERTLIVAELRASEERERLHAQEMKNILFAMPAAVCIAHDQTLQEITENELYKKWFRANTPALPLATNGHPSHIALREAAAGREVRNYQFSDLKPDGTVRHLVGNAITVWDEIGRPRGAICAFIDITSLKISESKLVSVSAGSAAKSDYITHMTHELRTPLGTMLGYAQLLESNRPALRPEQLLAIRQILKAGWHLRELINEVQQLSTIDARATAMKHERVDLALLLDDMRAMIAPLLLAKGISAQFISPGNIVINGSLQYCKQVMLNLLSNAIKYNRDGGAIFVSCEPDQAQMVRIVVRDTGDGLDPVQLASLFQPFNRLGQETGVEVGTGVGLIVTKRLVEAMGGSVGVESQRGLGTSFWLRLPMADANQV